ncbi:MAG: hypothetical protein LBU84_07470 [Prevotella sp.]|jgi:hypothetical protein|nr:hypothetical protein [Prevotella sp.]
MKKLSKLVLREKVDLLSYPEMKLIVGGESHCHCFNGRVVPVSSCTECFDVCGGSGTVQNCNYVAQA